MSKVAGRLGRGMKIEMVWGWGSSRKEGGGGGKIGVGPHERPNYPN